MGWVRVEHKLYRGEREGERRNKPGLSSWKCSRFWDWIIFNLKLQYSCRVLATLVPFIREQKRILRRAPRAKRQVLEHYLRSICANPCWQIFFLNIFQRMVSGCVKQQLCAISLKYNDHKFTSPDDDDLMTFTQPDTKYPHLWSFCMQLACV